MGISFFRPIFIDRVLLSTRYMIAEKCLMAALPIVLAFVTCAIFLDHVCDFVDVFRFPPGDSAQKQFVIVVGIPMDDPAGQGVSEIFRNNKMKITKQ